MTIETARFNMIEQQIRTWDVLDQHVLDTINHIPRENFVPQSYQSLAFADTEIPLEHGEMMMSPKLEGRIIQSMQLTSQTEVFEVGTGSGYLTALMSSIAKSVYSIDIHEVFLTTAKNKLAALNLNNVTLERHSLFSILPMKRTFDAVVITGSLTAISEPLLELLKPSAKLFCIIGDGTIMEATLCTNTEHGMHSEVMFETYVAPLIGSKRKYEFEF